MSKSAKIICFVLGILFISFAAFQYDDPDGLLWMGVYGVAGAISFAVAYNKLSKSVIIGALLAYLVGAIAQWPPQYEGLMLKMSESIYVEQAREALGLFICSLAMGYYLYLVVVVRSKYKSSTSKGA